MTGQKLGHPWVVQGPSGPCTRGWLRCPSNHMDDPQHCRTAAWDLRALHVFWVSYMYALCQLLCAAQPFSHELSPACIYAGDRAFAIGTHQFLTSKLFEADIFATAFKMHKYIRPRVLPEKYRGHRRHEKEREKNRKIYFELRIKFFLLEDRF